MRSSRSTVDVGANQRRRALIPRSTILFWPCGIAAIANMIADLILGLPRDWFLTLFGIVVGALIGFLLGLRTNYIIGRAFEYRAFLNQALIEVRLVSGKLKADSYDYHRMPRADQAVRLYADQIEHLGQRTVAASLRRIEKELAAKFDAARQRTEDLDFEDEKGHWIVKLESLRPNWWTFVVGKRSN
jgi:hypothetical protein